MIFCSTAELKHYTFQKCTKENFSKPHQIGVGQHKTVMVIKHQMNKPHIKQKATQSTIQINKHNDRRQTKQLFKSIAHYVMICIILLHLFPLKFPPIFLNQGHYNFNQIHQFRPITFCICNPFMLQ